MPISSLAAQLASAKASNSQQKNIGSVIPNSGIAGEESVGRGLRSGADSSKYKPSVLHESARAASDVPLTTLRENAVSSLRQLAKMTGDESFIDQKYVKDLCGIHSLEFERGQATKRENSNVDEVVRELLLLLTIGIGESPTNTSEISSFSSALHVLEYLIRKYDIHARQECAERLLLCMIPHHTQPIFSRILQLVDLAAMPTWTFLRPYAAAGVPCPTRTVLAKRVSKDTVLVKMCCRLAKETARVHVDLSETRSKIFEEECEDGGDFDECQPGASHIISFVAALLVQTIGLQSKASGTIHEPTLRTIFPFILNSLNGKDGLSVSCANWRGFGYILTSCVAEHGVLAAEARQIITSALIQGAIRLSAVLRNSARKRNDQQARMEQLAAPVMTMVALLRQTKSDAEMESDSSMIPAGTSRLMMDFQDLPQVLGHLHSLLRYDMTDLVVSFIQDCCRSGNVEKALELIETPQLNKLWEKSSTTSRLVMQLVSDTCLKDATIDADVCRMILEALALRNSVGADTGIARFISTGKGDQRISPRRLADVLGQSYKADKLHDNSKGMLEMLPARVALEHADVFVRMKAIDRLLEEENHSVDDRDDESVLAALMRHIIHEEDLRMARKAGESCLALLRDSKRTGRVTEEFATQLKVAINKLRDLKAPDPTLLSSCFLIAAWTIKRLSETLQSEHSITFELRVLLLSAVGDASDPTSMCAVPALHVLLTGGEPQSSDASIDQLQQLLLRDECMLNMMERIVTTNPSTTEYLALLSFVVAGEKMAINDFMIDERLNTCLMNCYLSLLSSERAFPDLTGGLLIKNVLREGKDRESLLDLISKLVATESDQNFTVISRPAIVALFGAVKRSTVSDDLLVDSLLNSGEVRSINRMIYLIDDVCKLKLSVMVVMMLALCAHPESRVRESVVEFLRKRNVSKRELSFWFGLVVEWEKLRLDGRKELPSMLREGVRRQKKQGSALLVAVGELFDDTTKLQSSSGRSRAASVLLKAAAQAGEDSFPLVARWNLAGKRIYGLLLSESVEDDWSNWSNLEVPETVVAMLKGALTSEPFIAETDIAINATSSQSGTRKRTYSFDVWKGVNTISPYPPEMIEAIVEGINSSNKLITRLLLGRVVGARAWMENVFSGLPALSRRRIASSVLELSAVSGQEVSAIFYGLELEPKIISSLLGQTAGVAPNLVELSIVLEYVKLNAALLSSSKDLEGLVISLVTTLDSFSTGRCTGENDFIVCAAITALQHILGYSRSSGTEILASQSIVKCARLIEELLNSSSNRSNLATMKQEALQLLAILCKLDAAKVMPEILSAVETCLVQSTPQRLFRNFVYEIIPILGEKVDSSDDAMRNLFEIVLSRAKDENLQRVQLLVEIFAKMKVTTTIHPLGDFLILAMLKSEGTMKDDKYLARVLQCVPVGYQMQALNHIIAFFRRVCLDMIPCGSDCIKQFAMEEVAKGHHASLGVKTVKVVSLCLDLDRVALFVQSSTGEDAEHCLELWRQLLFLHCEITASPVKFGNKTTEEMDRLVERYQNFLPLPLFLSSVISVLEGRFNNTAKSRALRSLSERVIGADWSPSEAALGIETFPLMIQILDSKGDELVKTDLGTNDVLLRHAALFATDQMIRHLCLPDIIQDKLERATQLCFPALEKICQMLEAQTSTPLDRELPSNCDFFASLSLCAASLVRFLGMKCVPFLAALIDPLLTVLDRISRWYDASGNMSVTDNVSAIVQAIIQTLTAVAQTLPQFLHPHLQRILSTRMIFSRSVKGKADPEWDNLLIVVETSLAENIPARLLLPGCSAAILDCTDWKHKFRLVSVMTRSVDLSSGRELTALKPVVLTTAFDVIESGSESALDQTFKLIRSMVLKLPETQLQSIYNAFRDWTDTDESKRRKAFWGLSHVLCKELGILFLPALSLAITNAVADLGTCLNALAMERMKASKPSTKKRKIEPNVENETLENCDFLEDLLSTLDVAFRADTSEDGQWIKADEGSRYGTFLHPLCKLLKAKLPSVFPHTRSRVDPHQALVSGSKESDTGTVVSCLLSLAAAAGNESMWKPLNHSVLEACSNEDDTEVRRGGIVLLHGLIKNLGEEYMVMLPECLPVLSELLEDSDEEIAGLAQQCITTSEELLGEDLLDSFH